MWERRRKARVRIGRGTEVAGAPARWRPPASGRLLWRHHLFEPCSLGGGPVDLSQCRRKKLRHAQKMDERIFLTMMVAFGIMVPLGFIIVALIAVTR